MKKIIKVFVFVAFFGGFQFAKAQEQYVYNQYHFSYYLINPAVAGAERGSQLMIMAKQNWAGLKDAPSTQTATYFGRLKKGDNVGLGGYVFNDRNGNFYNAGGQFTFAYHIPLSSGRSQLIYRELDRQLSFAVSAKMLVAGFNSVKGVVDDANVSEVRYLPNANVGMYYTSYGFFLGLSATNIIPISTRWKDEPVAPLTGFLFLGYAFEVLDRNTHLEPSATYSMDINLRKQLDLNLKFSQSFPYNNFGYWIQFSYRHNLDKGIGRSVAAIPMGGLRFGKFHVGYAFNWSLSNIGTMSYGTHELMLGYTFTVPKFFAR